jgi:hypothetical protein
MLRLVLILICTASAAAAQDGMRKADVRLTQTDLTDYLSGQVLEFYNDSLATYRADGGYAYRYSPDGPPIPGTYRVMGDSRVCTSFANGFSRCDYIVQNGARHVMIIENGDRYPIRSRVAVP